MLIPTPTTLAPPPTPPPVPTSPPFCYLVFIAVTKQIYSSSESGSSGGAFVNIRNSSFIGNLAQDRGGAILAEGSGSVEVSNCTFERNEAVGLGNYRRAGSGGSIFASPGVDVTVRGRG